MRPSTQLIIFGGTSSASGSTPGDVTAPSIVALSPADNASGASTTNNLTVQFDEDIAFGAAVDIALFLTDDTPVEAWDEGDIDSGISISGDTLTINPTATLEVESGYYVQITSGSIEDTSGNAFGGITTETGWNFTTEAEGGETFFLLQENGDALLQESGDNILLEEAA